MLGRIMTLLLSFFGNQVPFKEIYMGAKLTRDGLMMVDFICQLDQAREYLYIWSNIILGICV